MLNTYIKNSGTSKTIVLNNNKGNINEINWDADYDGDIAHLSLSKNIDGKKEHYNISLNNDDLAELLSYPTVNKPIHERLQMDYIIPTSPLLINNSNMSMLSPKSDEEFIIPVTIERNKLYKNNIKNKKSNSHITYKVYKKRKSSKKSKSKTKSHKKYRKTPRIKYTL